MRLNPYCSIKSDRIRKYFQPMKLETINDLLLSFKKKYQKVFQEYRSNFQVFQFMFAQFDLWMEPGRYIVAESGVILTRVGQIKRKVQTKSCINLHAHPLFFQGTFVYVGMNTGMNSLIRPALYQSYHRILNLSRCSDTDVYEFHTFSSSF